MARLFVALDPPGEARSLIASWGRAACGAWEGARPRPLPAAALHLTLCFLGEVGLDGVEPLAEALGAITTPEAELGLGGPLLLPRRRPRALAVAVLDHGGALAALHSELWGLVRGACGVEPPRGGLLAHITDARMGRGTALPGPLPPTPSLRFTGRRVVLYRSVLEPSGARYEELAGADLAIA